MLTCIYAGYPGGGHIKLFLLWFCLFKASLPPTYFSYKSLHVVVTKPFSLLARWDFSTPQLRCDPPPSKTWSRPSIWQAPFEQASMRARRTLSQQRIAPSWLADGRLYRTLAYAAMLSCCFRSVWGMEGWQLLLVPAGFHPSICVSLSELISAWPLAYVSRVLIPHLLRIFSVCICVCLCDHAYACCRISAYGCLCATGH